MKHFEFDDGPSIEGFKPVAGKMKLYKGGGGSSTTKQEIPDELKPLATEYTTKAIDVGRQDFNPYTDQRFEDMNQTQNLGMNMATNRAVQGSQTMDNAELGLNNQMFGDDNIATANPYGNINATANPYGATQEQTNPYAGLNPYLDQTIAKAQGSVVDRFNNMTKPQTEAAMNQSGSFGNSGYNQLMQNQQKAAGEQMSDIANQMYMQDYGNQQRMADSAIGRNLQNQQFMSNQGDTFAGRDLQAQQANANMGQNFAGRQDSVSQNQDAKRLQAIGMAPQFGNAAYQDASQLLNVGGMLQDDAQRGLDFDYQQFQDEANLPYKQLAAQSGVFGSNLGGSSSTTSSGGGK